MAEHRGNFVALCHFDPAEYGHEYLELYEGDLVEMLDAPTGDLADHHWTYGAVEGRGEGWFPTDFVRRPAEDEDTMEPAKVLDDRVRMEKVEQANLTEHMRKAFPQDVPETRQASYVALGDFNAEDYGAEYVSLHRGAHVELLNSEASDEEWSYGNVFGHGVGWFPTQFLYRVWFSLAEMQADLAQMYSQSASGQQEYPETHISASIVKEEHDPSSHGSLRLDTDDCVPSLMKLEHHRQIHRQSESFCIAEEVEELECGHGTVESMDIAPDDLQLQWYLQDSPSSELLCEKSSENEAAESLDEPVCFQAHPIDDVSAGKINALYNLVLGQHGIWEQNEFSMTADRAWRCHHSWSSALNTETMQNFSGAIVTVSRSKKRAIAEAHRLMLWKTGLANLDELLLISTTAESSPMDCNTHGELNIFDGAVAQRLQSGVFVDSAVARRIRDSVLKENCSQNDLVELARDAVGLAEGGNEKAWSIAFPPLFDKMVWHCDGSCISAHLHALKGYCDGRLSPRVWGAMMDSVGRCPDELLTKLWLDILSCELRCDVGAFANAQEAAIFMSCRYWLAREGHAELRQALDPWSGGEWIPISTPFTVESLDMKSSSLTLSTPGSLAVYMLKELPETRDYIVMAADHDHGQRLLGMVSKIGNSGGRRTFRMNPSAFQEGWSHRVQEWQLRQQHVNVMPLSAFGTTHRRMEAALTSVTNPRMDRVSGDEFDPITPSRRPCQQQDLYNLIFSMDVADMFQQWPTCKESSQATSSCNYLSRSLAMPSEFYHAIADLTAMQQKAVHLACEQQVTLIQGPPGTGKTNTATRIVEAWRTLFPGQKVLCCSDSNAAADNFAAALLRRNIKCIRLGHASDYKNSTHLRHLPGYRDYMKSPEDMWRRTRLEAQAIKKFGVVAATCVGSGHDFLQKFDFSRVVIDECTQATLLSTFVPLSLGASHIALLGDHKQLPPTVLDTVACQQGLSRSLFERLIEPHPSWGVMLDVQFRMHPSIAVFPSCEFYGGKVSSHESTKHLSSIGGLVWPSNGCRVRHIDTQGHEYSLGTSIQNDDEVAAILDLLPKVSLDWKDIGIITPYQAQKRLIRRKLREAGYSGIAADTIDGFQGSERELIIISLVRCNRSGRVGFLQDPRRANVALTRARRGLIVIASRSTLTASKRQREDADCWSRWAEWVERSTHHAASLQL